MIASIIITQLKAIDKWALGSWGATHLTNLGNGLKFKVRCPKHKGWVQINYDNGLDLYNVSFYTFRKVRNKPEWKINVKKEVNGVYCDMLVSVIDDFVG